jgi:predicted small secreted protein
MKKILSLSLVFVLLLSAFVLASCKGTDKDAQNTAPPPSAASETAAPTETPTAAPETEAPTADPYPRPDPVTVEWLAGEMQRRYYVGCMNLELMDFSDIMDRNEDTDLFFWDNQLEIDLKKLGQGYNFVNVTIEEAYVKQIVDETETEITADVAVFTMHPAPSIPESGTGMDFRITVDKQRMVIISYSEPFGYSTIYTARLLPLASSYRREGLPWQEANKKAYEELYAETVAFATAYPRQTPRG